MNHFVNGAKHRLRRVYPSVEGFPRNDGTDYFHAVLRVTMMDGQKYVLDMSGAQYGWQEPVMSWELYSTSRVREIKEEAPFGKTREFCKKRAKSMGPQCEWIQRIGEGFAKNLEEALKSWQKDNKISTVDLLRLPEPEFQKQQASLLDAAKQAWK